MSAPVGRRSLRYYFSIRLKFVISLALAALWTLISIFLARVWVGELAEVTNWPFAIFAITFIAFIPGFMQTFLVASILLDRRPRRREQAFYPPVSILVAAYQEEAAIADTIRSLSSLVYPGTFEILVINDGSRDGTLERARRASEVCIFPEGSSCRVIDLPQNVGKANALNAGLAEARHDFILTVDGDTMLLPQSLMQIVERMLSDPIGTEAVAGAVLLRNDRANLLTSAQKFDYFHGIAAVKRMQSMYHGTLVAQGAFSLYRRRALEAVGGWPDTVGEDIVLTWAMLRKGFRIGYAEDALVFTNAPTTYRVFALQRKRWSRGLIEAFFRHWRLLFAPRMTTLFVWWNLLFLPLDFTYSFIFIPGVILAFFGIYWIAGPMTLAVLPLAVIWNIVIHRKQRVMFQENGLSFRRSVSGFLTYMLVYALLMQPICVWGYVAEIVGLRKRWDTR